MHASILTALLLAPPAPIDAESGGSPAQPPSPATAYHHDRTTLGQAGMGVLTGWSVGNIAVGLAGSLTTTGPVRFFHQGNAAWNTVNLTLGIWGLVSQHREAQLVVDLPTGRARARRSQRTFGINAGLDVVYISTGAILWSLGRDLGYARVHGYGQALVLQGSFLLAFDVAMMLGHEWLLDHSGPRPMARVRLRPMTMRGPDGGLTPGLALRVR